MASVSNNNSLLSEPRYQSIFYISQNLPVLCCFHKFSLSCDKSNLMRKLSLKNKIAYLPSLVGPHWDNNKLIRGQKLMNLNVKAPMGLTSHFPNI